MADGRLLLDSIDDYLGPGEKRFFSRGYQRSRYRVHGLAVDAAQPAVTGRVDVAYPADWSTKDGVDQRPHLSTIDALVLAVQLAEVHLALGQGLTPAERSAAVLRKAVIRAGGAPQEDLGGIELSARLVQRQDAYSGYDCSVGGFRVRCEIGHPAAQSEPGPAAGLDGFEPVLGPAGDRFYGAGFTTRRHHIRAVDVDRASLTAHADVHFDAEPGVAGLGVGGARQPAVELVDAFVVSLQLAQVLMYELDGLSRGRSNTLWMMQTVLTAPADAVALPSPGDRLPATVRLANTRVLPLRGGIWRSVDIHGELAGITLRAAFAHELPADSPSVAAPAQRVPA
ncbi:AvrD family protein [Hamadaea tsunoensis]|uniref:AvrD family protein n=1 Tax=Hamadaea tsunoensis TaxID=53368 RepID=UPI00040637D0|nr:AvrD family protein [Hamadaea tsunoensis]